MVVDQPIDEGGEFGVGEFLTVYPVHPETEPCPKVVLERGSVVEVDRCCRQGAFGEYPVSFCDSVNQ